MIRVARSNRPKVILALMLAGFVVSGLLWTVDRMSNNNVVVADQQATDSPGREDGRGGDGL